MALIAVNYNPTVAILITEKEQNYKIYNFDDDRKQLPTVEAKGDYSEDVIRGVYLCQFPILSKTELNLIRNVDEFKTEDGDPYQIPPMPRILAAAGQGSLLSRGIKDCRDEFALPNGSRIKEVKMKQPPESIFKNSNITVIEKKADAPSLLSSNQDKPKDVSKAGQTGGIFGINNKSTEVFGKKSDTKNQGLGVLFNNASLTKNDETKKPEVLASQGGLFRGKTSEVLGNSENSNPKKNTEPSKTSEMGGDSKVKISNIQHGSVTPINKELYPIASTKTIPLIIDKSSSSISKPEQNKPTTESSKTLIGEPSQKKEEVIYQTSSEAFRAIKVDTHLKKLDFKSKEFSKLESIFMDMEMTLGERPDNQGYTISQLPPGSLVKTTSTALDLLKRDKENLIKCRNEIANLKQINKDTEQIASLISSSDTNVGKAIKASSFLEDLHNQNEIKSESLRQSLKTLEGIETNMKQFMDVLASRDGDHRLPDVSQNTGKNSQKASKVIAKGVTGSAYSKTDQNSGDSFFFKSSGGSLFGASSKPLGSKKPDWGALQAKRTPQSYQSDLDTQFRVKGTMIDRIGTFDLQGKNNLFTQKAPGKLSSLINESQNAVRSSPRPDFELQSLIQDHFERYFKFKTSTLHLLEKRLLNEQSKVKTGGSISFNLNSLLGDCDDQSFRLHSRLDDDHTCNVFSSDIDKKLNLNEQKRFFRSLAAKKLKARHCLDVSLRNQLIEEHEQEERRQLKTIEEQDDKLLKAEMKRQATFTIAQSKPLVPPVSKPGNNKDKLPDSTSIGVAPGLQTGIMNTPTKPDTSAAPGQKILGGIFGAESKPADDSLFGQNESKQVKEGNKEDNKAAEVKSGLFGGKTGNKDDKIISSTGLFDNATDKNQTGAGAQLKKETRNPGIFDDTGKDNEPKTLFGTQKASGAGISRGILDKPAQGVGKSASLFDAPANIKEATSEDMDENAGNDNDSSDGPSLQHTTSQIGASKTASRQTNPMSKAVSNADGTKQNKIEQSKTTSEQPKQQASTGGLFNIQSENKEEDNNKKPGLFSQPNQKSNDIFASMASDKQPENIFAGLNTQKKDESTSGAANKRESSTLFQSNQETKLKLAGDKKTEGNENKSMFQGGALAIGSQPAIGLFGGNTSNTSDPVSSGGLFGTSTADKPATNISGGIFPTTPASTTGQQPGGLFSTSANSMFGGAGVSTTQNQGGLNIQGAAFGFLLSDGGEKKPAQMFGQSTNLARAGGIGMGSSGFGGGGAQMQSMNFANNFSLGGNSGSQPQEQGNLFMKNSTPGSNPDWLGVASQQNIQPQGGSTQSSSAMHQIRG